MIRTGGARAVADLAAGLPARYRSRTLRLLLGDALRTVGDVAAAAHAYETVAAAASTWDSGLARLGDAAAGVEYARRAYRLAAAAADDSARPPRT
jgi:hypothetical protein